MHYVYVLRSDVDALLYTGCTGDLRNRLSQHNEGKVPATQRRTPLRLIYYEACLSVDDAYRREKYLKTSYGKRYLKSRLRHYFTGQANSRIVTGRTVKRIRPSISPKTALT